MRSPVAPRPVRGHPGGGKSRTAGPELIRPPAPGPAGSPTVILPPGRRSPEIATPSTSCPAGLPRPDCEPARMTSSLTGFSSARSVSRSSSLRLIDALAWNSLVQPMFRRLLEEMVSPVRLSSSTSTPVPSSRRAALSCGDGDDGRPDLEARRRWGLIGHLSLREEKMITRWREF